VVVAGAVVGVAAVGVTTVADLPLAPFSAECWLRPIIIRRRIIIRHPAITTMPRQMAPLTIACDGSGRTIPGAAPISATTATDILVHDGFFVGYVRIDIGCVSNSWIGMARYRSSRHPRM
jgi:hypothetical protein